jgi:hypothetical protein
MKKGYRMRALARIFFDRINRIYKIEETYALWGSIQDTLAGCFK